MTQHRSGKQLLEERFVQSQAGVEVTSMVFKKETKGKKR